MKLNIDLMFMAKIFPRIIKHIHITLGITIIAMLLSLIIGIILALVRTYKIPYLDSLAKIYISFFRGTPLLVQLFLLYYGLPQIIPGFASLSAYSAAFIGLSLNSGAYMAEIIRGSISSIDRGQMEAVLSVGMNSWQGMRRIILPQAMRVALPALGNRFISLLKESSLAFVLGVSEVLAQAKMTAAATYRFFESYLIAAIIYWIITVILTHIQNKIENKLNSAY